MELLGSDDPTTLSYWLRWKVLLCAICVVTPMIIAAFLIWKYERSEWRGRKQHDDSSWKPCLRGIHPVFLLLYRILAFSLLMVAMGFDLGIHGFQLFLYYTQWTFTLVTFYFGLGSVLSFRGCWYHLKITKNSGSPLSEDVENGIYAPLVGRMNENRNGLLQKSEALPVYGFWDHMFQALYQMTAGAVALTDSVYWIVIFPFLTLRDYQMNFLTVVTHTMNAVLLLGDTALNKLPFPWFGISYFILLTGVYVFFQWILHACIQLWWPYPFLDLSAQHSPLWYLIVAAMHVPSYYLYLGVARVKRLMLSRWFPNSYMR